VSEDHREYLGDILTSARHLLQLINTVLDISKVESGKMEFRPESFPIERVTGEVRDVIRPLAERKSHSLSFECPPGFEVTTDPARLKQILYNFLSNAVKFTPNGGFIRLRVSAEGEAEFRVEVEDNGPGIEPEDLSRLFVEFQQVGRVRAPEGGTGLGLALTKHLAEAQGGRVEVRSEVGRGSAFSVILPRGAGAGAAVAAAPGEEAAVAPRRGLPPRTRTVLVVEDNEADARWMRRILTVSGYKVEVASSAGEAVTLCLERSYQAIALDLLLRDGSGAEALQEIRNTPLNRLTPVVLVSVAAEQDTCAGLPIDDVLTKPVEPDALLRALERAGVPSRQNKTVLVVDDEPASLRLMAATLSGLGYRPVCRGGGEEGLAAAAGEHPAVILLDLLMPGMDGFEFLERLRAGGSRTPVIVWTSKDLTTDEYEKLRGAAQSIIAKKESTPGLLLAQLRAVAG
jgi:CheY-like chemotaxis protein/anti-sigma regulatory factor (Ser/Thr protein kinase)